MSGIAVQGNFLYAMGPDRILFKYNKDTLVEVTRRDISSKVQNFNWSGADIAAVGANVFVSNNNNREVCYFSASDLSDATFNNCKNIATRPRGMAAAGKTTASTSDDFIYIYRHNRTARILKYSVDSVSATSFDTRLSIPNILGGTNTGQIQNALAIDVDSSGNLYAAEMGEWSQK